MLTAQQPASPAPAMLLTLKGIGPEFAAVLWSEGLSRHFDNRRQVAAYAGLAPTPWQSGSVDHDQGVSKSGNPRLRTTLIQMAWLWLRHQPHAALTCFHHTIAKVDSVWDFRGSSLNTIIGWTDIDPPKWWLQQTPLQRVPPALCANRGEP